MTRTCTPDPRLPVLIQTFLCATTDANFDAAVEALNDLKAAANKSRNPPTDTTMDDVQLVRRVCVRVRAGRGGAGA
jgi:hypothetical protein